MPLIVLSSVSGAPGVTCTATAVAASWPSTGIPVVLAELDLHGGDLAIRFGLSPAIGVLSLATAVRERPSLEAILAHSRRVRLAGASLDVLVAPIPCHESTAAISQLVQTGALSGHPDVLVIGDLGRIATPEYGHAPPVWPLLSNADLVLLVTPPRTDALAHWWRGCGPGCLHV
jgi:MinD-like ATPase involved in chromosome partitioning or flagellar assembly